MQKDKPDSPLTEQDVREIEPSTSLLSPDDLALHSSAQKHASSKKPLYLSLAGVIVVLFTAGAWFMMSVPGPKTDGNATQIKSTQSIPVEQTPTSGESVASVSHAPDHTKLPLGDNKYSTSAKKGYVYSCQTSFNGGGAFTQGPWINASTKTWDLSKKATVDGNTSWPGAIWKATGSGATRSISSKDVPLGHGTGTFPISSKDDAYSYDRNPNSIKEQIISFTVPLTPAVLSSPQCVGGEVGIATTGVLIFNAFDAGGRDAVAMEVQDNCEGHPQAGSYYHYHGYSDCFKDTSKNGEHSALLGYAFDGFGMYGIKGEDGKELSTNDLDECHGHTHKITWDSKETSMYHYHFTHDFPYTVSCFRGTPSVKALSVGEGGGQQSQAGSPSGGQQGPPPPSN